MTQIDQQAVSAVRALATVLRDRVPLTKRERQRLYEPHSRRALNTMLETGAAYGEATGAPGTAVETRDEKEFKEHLRSIDNDLSEQVRIVREGVDHYFANGEVPAPYYAWRIAVILRKAKEYELEADFLEGFARHFGDCVGARYTAIVERACKARQRASSRRA